MGAEEWARNSMAIIVERLLDQPNEELSRGELLRFGRKGSLLVDTERAVWYDHEEKCGGGALDLAVYRMSCTPDEAKKWLRENGESGAVAPGHGGPARELERHDRAIPDFGGASDEPPELDKLRLPGYGLPEEVYAYRDESKGYIAIVARYDQGRRKTYRTWSRWSWAGQSTRWIRRAPPTPRPLFKLDEWGLRAMVLEGEKTAVQAASMFPDWWTTCWLGGSMAWKHTSLEPLLKCNEIVFIPDLDQIGMRSALDAMEHIGERAPGIRMSLLDLAMQWPASWKESWPRPKGWDAADMIHRQRVEDWRRELPWDHVLKFE